MILSWWQIRTTLIRYLRSHSFNVWNFYGFSDAFSLVFSRKRGISIRDDDKYTFDDINWPAKRFDIAFNGQKRTSLALNLYNLITNDSMNELKMSIPMKAAAQQSIYGKFSKCLRKKYMSLSLKMT